MFNAIMDKQRHNESLMKAVAERFAELRKSAGLSQIQVYREVRIHIGRIESGYSNITIGTFSDLCKYYKISFTDFFDSIETESLKNQE